MLIVALVVLWIAVLSPIIIRRFREQNSDRSIVNFHERMEKLSVRTPIVEPAHRLAVNDESPVQVASYETQIAPRPRLRVVPADATVGQLDRDQSWVEWSRSYSDDPFEETTTPRHAVVANNPRAAAYSRVPATTLTAPMPHRGQFGSRSQKVRRRRVLLSLASSTALSTIVVLFASSIIVDAWTLVSWLSLVSFLGLMYYAMSVGMIESQSAPVRRTTPRLVAQPVRTATFENEFDAFHDPEESTWSVSDSQERYAHAL